MRLTTTVPTIIKKLRFRKAFIGTRVGYSTSFTSMIAFPALARPPAIMHASHSDLDW
jgi:hypothetical protein